ncbi:hypothetical protein Tco_1070498 [Tanacetum coccineum]|uniref:Gag-pol polyprotein n=1 Tax=Tanacetum coccineum TaxID=301880 RepID=A0ABQ5HMY0_9ASTR
MSQRPNDERSASSVVDGSGSPSRRDTTSQYLEGNTATRVDVNNSSEVNVPLNEYAIDSKLKSVELVTYYDAIKDNNWVKAMNSEIEALNKNSTWTITDFPTDDVVVIGNDQKEIDVFKTFLSNKFIIKVKGRTLQLMRMLEIRRLHLSGICIKGWNTSSKAHTDTVTDIGKSCERGDEDSESDADEVYDESERFMASGNGDRDGSTWELSVARTTPNFESHSV